MKIKRLSRLNKTYNIKIRTKIRSAVFLFQWPILRIAARDGLWANRIKKGMESPTEKNVTHTLLPKIP